MIARAYAFGPFLFDAELGTLSRSGAPVAVGTRGAALLGVLLKANGDTATKAALMDAAWPGLVVEESNLSVQIATLRKMLGTRPEGGEWIATIPRVGYRLAGAALVENMSRQVGSSEQAPASSRPSIAVLPFLNLSGDPEQEYFADGMVEEIITALSRVGWLMVIARNSSFTYKGRAVDVKQVGRELGVRYVLEGSVRKAGSRVRIAGQLIDTSTGAHLWAERFEGELESVFDLQDKVTGSVVAAVAPKLEQAEAERSRRKPPTSLDAYDYFLRGMSFVHQWTRESNAEALAHFSRAIELDANFAAAYGMAARCYAQRKSGGWSTDREHEAREAERLGRRAGDLGMDDAVALAAAGVALAFVAGDLDTGADFTDRALDLNPNLAWAWLFGGLVKAWIGEPEVALQRIGRAMRLSPHDPQTFNMHGAMAYAHFFAGRYQEAFSWAVTTVREKPNLLYASCLATASAALGGRPEDARNWLARVRSLDPGLCLSNLGDFFPTKRAEDVARWREGMQLAGLPE